MLSIAMLVAPSVAPPVQCRMARGRKELETWQRDDARRLSVLFKSRVKLSQEEFGAKYEIGTQGMVWQYLAGHTPLNYESAYKFAWGIGCSISDFSPRLATELVKYAEYAVPKRRKLTENA